MDSQFGCTKGCCTHAKARGRRRRRGDESPTQNMHLRVMGRAACTNEAVRIIHRRAGRKVAEYRISNESHALTSVVTAGSTSGNAASLEASAFSYLLPMGYPASVGTDYMNYSTWCATAGVFASAGGVLATQSLLCAVGVGSGGASTPPFAASLNWVLKDGIGQLAAVVSAAVISDRFDADPKRWRSLAAYAEATARCLNASTPFAPWAFLPIASVANLGYSVACLAASATKADFHRSLARQQNLGDVTAKAGSQAISASLIGTGVGVCLSAGFVSTPGEALGGCLLFTGLQLLATEQALRALALPTLTPAVGETLSRLHLDGQALPSPAAYARAQRLITAPLSLVNRSTPSLRIGSPSLSELAADSAAFDSVRRSCAGSLHLLRVDSSSGEVRVLMLEGAGSADVLLALLHAGLVRGLVRCAAQHSAPSVAAHPHEFMMIRERLTEAQRRLAGFTMELRAAGWDVESAMKLEDEPSRLSIQSHDELADSVDLASGSPRERQDVHVYDASSLTRLAIR